jgi:hypothetical protein
MSDRGDAGARLPMGVVRSAGGRATDRLQRLGRRGLATASGSPPDPVDPSAFRNG